MGKATKLQGGGGGMDDGENAGNMRKTKCLFGLDIVGVFLKDPMSPSCFHHSPSLAF